MLRDYARPGPASSKKQPGAGGGSTGAAVTPALPGSPSFIVKPAAAKSSTAVKALFQGEGDDPTPPPMDEGMDLDIPLGPGETADVGADERAALVEQQKGDVTREKR